MGMLEQTEEEQVLSDLQSLKTLYGLLHKDHADENLDETSRAFLMRILDDATQQVLLRQAKMILGPVMSPVLERKLSIQLDPRTRGDAVPRLKPIASPSPSLHASERSHYRHAHEDHLLVHIASNRSSKTAMPQHGTVAGETPCSDRRGGHVPRRSSGRGDQSSIERSSNTSRSLSRESSVQERAWRLHPGTSASRGVETEGSSMHCLSRLDSGLSMSVASRGGSGRGGKRGSGT
ncbi:uncharacterized protein LOC133914620 [Phragmites australis]|uniref:uncharacterized protein LOC133914620 n=1 Tax=Phragmites australis TaxID=29695 RepID=UPI002D76AFEC|nr:uncharacterized protein LOC133914620 [Phragmites australis]